MRYAIHIHLDYSSYPQDEVKTLFAQVRDGFIQAGFRQDGRLFTAPLPEREAVRLARQVVEQAAERSGFGDPYRYITEFYGFDFEHAPNLLLPTAEIDVVDLAATAGFELIDLALPVPRDEEAK